MIIKGILMDLDGVIAETSEYHFQAWKELAARIGISIDRQFNECLKGVSRMESLNLILKHGSVLEKYSKEKKSSLAEWKNTRYVELLQQLKPSDVMPGIRELLSDARKSRVKSAIASASKNADFIIKSLGLNEDIYFIADAAKVERSKPFPDIFLAAATGLAVSPEYCVGIEDATVGITAIHAAGMKAIGIGRKENLYEAELLLSSTSQLVFSDIQSYFSELDYRQSRKCLEHMERQAGRDMATHHPKSRRI